MDPSTLDKIEKAQRTVGRGEWWCMNLGTMQSLGSRKRAESWGEGEVGFLSDVINW